MAEQNKQLILNVYDKLGKLVAQSEKGNYTVTLKGVKEIKDQEYSVAFEDEQGNLSKLADVPATSSAKPAQGSSASQPSSSTETQSGSTSQK